MVSPESSGLQAGLKTHALVLQLYFGPVVQLVSPESSGLQAGLKTHALVLQFYFGPVVQLVRMPALQAGGQGFESLQVHKQNSAPFWSAILFVELEVLRILFDYT